jgi:hypothetical protein
MTFTTEGADALTLEPLSPSKEWKHVLIEVRSTFELEGKIREKNGRREREDDTRRSGRMPRRETERMNAETLRQQ